MRGISLHRDTMMVTSRRDWKSRIEERRLLKNRIKEQSPSEGDELSPLDCVAAKALLSLIDNDPAYHLRKMRRYISKNFSTPMEKVRAMDLEDLAREYHEAVFEELMGSESGREHLHDIIVELSKPEISKEEEEDIGRFIEDAEREEEKRKESGLSLMQYLRRETFRKGATPPSEEGESPGEAKSFVEDEEEVHVSFDDDVPQFTVDELREMSDEHLEDLVNNKGE